MKTFFPPLLLRMLLLLALLSRGPLHAQDLPPAPPALTPAPAGPATLQINAGQAGARINPLFYGLMTEEINYAYDGGLYGELIQNRQFKNDPASAVHWSLVQDGGASGTMALDTTQPVSAALPVSLKLTATGVSGSQRVGAANDGYWGIPVKPNTRYRASFYARADAGFAGPLTVDIESRSGSTVYAQGQAAKITGEWKPYTVMLTTGKAAGPSEDTRFVISTNRPGTVRLSLVSLFPPTFHGRPNGNRIDLMQKQAEMSPAFLRLPGGNYLEGDTIETRFEWKDTIGPLTQRPGHLGPWKYRSDDGLGLLEFLEWCEDLKMEPLLAVYAGYSLNRTHVNPGPDLEPYVQDALDEIEYVTGDAGTKWGAVRAKDGHPAPFKIEYIEVGNEDQFDRSGSYNGRFGQFFDAIRARYPQYKIIATTPVKSRTPDLVDDHFYRRPQEFEQDAHHYDTISRSGPKIFVGEWASQMLARPWLQASIDATPPTPNLDCALGDAAWMTGMERNADLIVMNCYAPLFANANPGGRQWATNLIGYDALTSYGSPSYYVLTMFGRSIGDMTVPATLTGGDLIFESVTRDSKKGTLAIKLVNASATAQAVHVTLSGAASVSPNGTATVLSGSSPADTNSLAEPAKIAPVTTPVSGLGSRFDYRLAPYSVTVLQLQAKIGTIP